MQKPRSGWDQHFVIENVASTELEENSSKNLYMDT